MFVGFEEEGYAVVGESLGVCVGWSVPSNGMVGLTTNGLVVGLNDGMVVGMNDGMIVGVSDGQ